MDQKKIGQFIQTLRKSKGLTQKALAAQLGVSDKTVSKWEMGNGMPDISLIMKLCGILEINVNELLSGEKLTSDSYSEKAETNMLSLLTEQKSYQKKEIIIMIIGFVLLLFSFFYIILFNRGISDATWYFIASHYVDLSSLLELILPVCACVFLCGIRRKGTVIRTIKKCVLPVGAFITLFNIIGILWDYSYTNSDAPLLMMPAVIAVSFLPVFYALVIYIAIVLVEGRFVLCRPSDSE